MFHAEVRMGMHSVRQFNLSEQRLWLELLSPLLSDQEFAIEGHDFIPRQTRLTVYEGPELRPDQLGMGRGWQNVERSAADVTERVLTAAREHIAAQAAKAPQATHPAQPPLPGAAASTAADLLRERLIGRLAAGPISAEEIIRIAAELLPDGSEAERLEAARQAAWALLERDLAQLTPNGR